MKLLLAATALAGLSGCAAYTPYYGGTDAFPGYGGYPPAYGAVQAYPAPFYDGGSSIFYGGATIIAPRPAYGVPPRHHWREHGGRGDRGQRGQHDGRRDRSGQRDGSGWQR